MSPISFQMLGGIDLRDANGTELRSVIGQSKRLLLLAYLVLGSRRGYRRRDQIVAAFWPDLPAERGRNALRQAVHFLRTSLGDGVLTRRGDEDIGVALDQMWCDAIDLEAAFAAADWERCVGLYRGELLEGLFASDAAAELDEWIAEERARMRAMAAEAAWNLAERCRADGNSADALRWGERAVTLGRGDERDARRLIDLLLQSGDRSHALQVYNSFADKLRREYGVTPALETEALVASLRTAAVEPPAEHGEETSAPRLKSAISETHWLHRSGAAFSGVNAATRVPPWLRGKRTRLSVLVGATTATVAAAGIYAMTHLSAPIMSPRIAVLPLVNETTGDTVAEYVRDGLTNGVIDGLARLSTARVLAWGTVASHRGEEPRGVGRVVGADAVMTWSAHVNRDTVHVRVELIDVRDGAQLWGAHYAQVGLTSGNLPLRVAADLVTARSLARSARDIDAYAGAPTADAIAYDAYLRGRYLWNKRTAADVARALEYLETAISRDSGFALAHAGRADALITLASLGARPGREVYPAAKAAAMRALELDPSLGEAHAALGVVLARYNWNHAGAAEALERAIALRPYYATAHQWYAIYLERNHLADSAVREARRAYELDPTSLIIRSALGVRLYNARRYREAVRQLEQTLELDPHYTYALMALGWSYVASGAIERAESVFASVALGNGGPTSARAALAYVFAATGRLSRARKLLDSLERAPSRDFVSPVSLAEVYVALGDTSRAFELLGHAVELRDDGVVGVSLNPRLDPLRHSERFKAILRRVRLTQTETR